MGEYLELKSGQSCTGVLLCGGKSRRMGQDKAFLQRDGRYLLQSHAETLAARFGRVLAVCERPGKFEGIPALAVLPQAADHFPEAGPLGGVCTALKETQTPWLFVMACDMPYIDENLLDKMESKIQNVDIVVCHHGDKIEPLFAFYHRRCLPVFRQELEKGERRMRSGFSRLRVAELLVEEAEAARVFANLNTPEDVKEFGLTLLEDERHG